MAEPSDRRTARRRPWRRSALPRSRLALAFGAFVAVALVVLLAIGLSRTRPGRDVPAYDPSATTTPQPRSPVVPPSITTLATIAAPAPTTPDKPTTTAPRR